MAQINVIWNGKPKKIDAGQTVEDVLGKEQSKGRNPVVTASVSRALVGLAQVLKEDDDVCTYDLSTLEGSRIFSASLSFVLIRAARQSNAQVRIKYSVGEGLFCEIEPKIKDPFDLVQLERAMMDLIEQDLPITRLVQARDEAMRLLAGHGESEVARLLRYYNADEVDVYELDGVYGAFASGLAPSTGYLHNFTLNYSNPGFIVLLPQRSDPEAELAYIHRPKLAHVFEQSDEWARILECADSIQLNEKIEKGELADFIRLNEALHEKTIANIADKICESKRRVVLIAGPSSSGKTTFSQRLIDQLRVNGKKPVLVSLDNYYRDRDIVPVGADGKSDLEHIDTLDRELFNQQVLSLVHGETVEIPRFSFKEGKRMEKGVPLRLPADGLILFEGIHGLNDSLTPGVGRLDKFKIYISALTQLNLDKYNRIPTTDVRCLRRIVRDYQFRGASALRTLDMWPSVRAGERRWIFPFQEQCDVMFNSALIYELPFLKLYAEPLLEEVPKDSEHYIEAQRLLVFLKYFVKPENESAIPTISILREFLGGGCFEH